MILPPFFGSSAKSQDNSWDTVKASNFAIDTFVYTPGSDRLNHSLISSEFLNYKLPNLSINSTRQSVDALSYKLPFEEIYNAYISIDILSHIKGKDSYITKNSIEFLNYKLSTKNILSTKNSVDLLNYKIKDKNIYQTFNRLDILNYKISRKFLYGTYNAIDILSYGIQKFIRYSYNAIDIVSYKSRVNIMRNSYNALDLLTYIAPKQEILNSHASVDILNYIADTNIYSSQHSLDILNFILSPYDLYQTYFAIDFVTYGKGDLIPEYVRISHNSMDLLSFALPSPDIPLGNYIIAIFIDEADPAYTYKRFGIQQLGLSWCKDVTSFNFACEQADFDKKNLLVFDVDAGPRFFLGDPGIWPEYIDCARPAGSDGDSDPGGEYGLPIPLSNIIWTPRPLIGDTDQQNQFYDHIKEKMENHYGYIDNRDAFWEFLSANSFKIILVIDNSSSLRVSTIQQGLNNFKQFLSTKNILYNEYAICDNERWLFWAKAIITNPNLSLSDCQGCENKPLVIDRCYDTISSSWQDCVFDLVSNSYGGVNHDGTCPCADGSTRKQCCSRRLWIKPEGSSNPVNEIGYWSDKVNIIDYTTNIKPTPTSTEQYFGIHPNLTSQCNLYSDGLYYSDIDELVQPPGNWDRDPSGVDGVDDNIVAFWVKRQPVTISGAMGDFVEQTTTATITSYINLERLVFESTTNKWYAFITSNIKLESYDWGQVLCSGNHRFGTAINGIINGEPVAFTGVEIECGPDGRPIGDSMIEGGNSGNNDDFDIPADIICNDYINLDTDIPVRLKYPAVPITILAPTKEDTPLYCEQLFCECSDSI